MPQVSCLSILQFCQSQSCLNSYSMYLQLPSIYLLMTHVCACARACYHRHRCGCDCGSYLFQLILLCFLCFFACLILQGYSFAFHYSKEGLCDRDDRASHRGRDHALFHQIHESGQCRKDRRSFLVKRTRRFRDK